MSDELHHHDNHVATPGTFSQWKNGFAAWEAAAIAKLTTAKESANPDDAMLAGGAPNKLLAQWAAIQDKLDKRKATLKANHGQNAVGNFTADEKAHDKGWREKAVDIALLPANAKWRQTITEIATGSLDTARHRKDDVAAAVQNVPAFNNLVNGNDLLKAFVTQITGGQKR